MGGLARFVLVGAALATASSLGCGGAEFVLGSSDGGGGGPSMDATTGSDGGGASDAGGSDTGTTDAGSERDAEPKDGGPGPSDAGRGDGATPPVNSGGGGGSDAGFACPSSDMTVIFCSDFDTASAPPWNWDGAPLYGAATEGVDTMNFLSAPNAFVASNDALGNGAGYTLAEVEETSLSSLAGHISFSFHVYVKTYDATNVPDVPFAQMGVGEASSTATMSFTIALVLKAGQLRLDQSYVGTDGGDQTQSATVGPYVTEKWSLIEMVLDRSGATGWTVTLYTDGVSRLDTPTVLSPPTASFQVSLGILGVLPPSNANAVEFDNVLVRAY